MKNIVIWGTGKLGSEAVKYIVEEMGGYHITAVYDSDINKVGGFFHGMLVADICNGEDDIRTCDILLLCAAKWEEMLKMATQFSIDIEKIRCWNDGIKRIDEMHGKLIYSQDGEELYLQEKFAKVNKGTYVDVGAYHPIRFSNTFWAYKKGWKGINIEPNPDNFSLFEILRTKDININCGISDKEGQMPYYMFDESGLNTFDKKRADMLIAKTGYQFEKVVDVSVCPLKDILEKHGIFKIEFLDIDVEEHEMEVLQSIDFSKVSIECIMVEQLNETLERIAKSEIACFLKKYEYVAVGKFDRTVIYERR